MASRPVTAVVLAAILVACSSPTSPAGSGDLSSGPPATNGPGATGTAGLVDAAAHASLLELAAAENQLVDDVARAANLPTDLGAETWAWVNKLVHDALKEGGERLVLTGPAALMAALDSGPPLTAVDGGGAVGLAMAAGLVFSGIGDPGGPPRDMNVGLDSTQDTTANGERTVAAVTGHIAMSASGSVLNADVEIGVNVTVTDAATGAVNRTATFRSRGTIKLDFCPDANGKVNGHVTMSLSGGTAGAGSATIDIDSDVIGTVGEDAYLQTVDANGTTTQTSTPPGGGRARRSVVRAGFTSTVGHNGSMNPGGTATGGVVEESDSLTDDEVSAAYGQIGTAMGVAIWLLGDKAQEKWRGGACVEIRSSERGRDVRKNELVQFEAKLFHKIENVELHKPIRSDFAGKASLDPNGIEVPAPMLLSFKAGPRVNDTGIVTLTSTSNRGIATPLDVHFRVKGGWVIDTPRGPRHIEGLKCGDPTGLWVVDGTYQAGGLDGTQKWMITIGIDEVHGTFTYRTDAQGRPGGGPIIVFLEGHSSGTVRLTLHDDGTASMHLKETQHSYKSWTAFDKGHGHDHNAALQQYDFEWDVGGNC